MTLPTTLFFYLDSPSDGHSDAEPQEQNAAADARGNDGIDTDALTRALRQSFQATVEEAVPDSLMDLINKLK